MKPQHPGSGWRDGDRAWALTGECILILLGCVTKQAGELRRQYKCFAALAKVYARARVCVYVCVCVCMCVCVRACVRV